MKERINKLGRENNWIMMSLGMATKSHSTWWDLELGSYHVRERVHREYRGSQWMSNLESELTWKEKAHICMFLFIYAPHPEKMTKCWWHLSELICSKNSPAEKYIFHNMSLKFLGWGEGWRSTEVLTEKIVFLAHLRAWRIEVHLFRQLTGTTRAVGLGITKRPQLTWIRLLKISELHFLPWG